MAKQTKAVETTPAVNETVVNNDATTTNVENVPVPPDVLEDLTAKLAEQKNVIKQHILNGGELDDEPVLKANLEIVRLNNLIKAENTKREREAKEREIAEKRNERVKLADDLIAAVRGANEDEIARTREIVINELLAKYANSTPAKKVADGDKPAGERGAISREIIEHYKTLTGEGMNATDAIKTIINGDEARGIKAHSRGTTGAVVLQYQKSIGEKE